MSNVFIVSLLAATIVYGAIDDDHTFSADYRTIRLRRMTLPTTAGESMIDFPSDLDEFLGTSSAREKRGMHLIYPWELDSYLEKSYRRYDDEIPIYHKSHSSHHKRHGSHKHRTKASKYHSKSHHRKSSRKHHFSKLKISNEESSEELVSWIPNQLKTVKSQLNAQQVNTSVKTNNVPIIDMSNNVNVPNNVTFNNNVPNDLSEDEVFIDEDDTEGC